MGSWGPPVYGFHEQLSMGPINTGIHRIIAPKLGALVNKKIEVLIPFPCSLSIKLKYADITISHASYVKGVTDPIWKPL